MRRLQNRPPRLQAAPRSRTTGRAIADCCGGEMLTIRMPCRCPVGDRPRLGASLGDQPAEPPLAAVILGDRTFQYRAVKVGPVGWHEDKFAVGRLPEQK